VLVRPPCCRPHCLVTAEQVAEFFDRGVQIALAVKAKTGKRLADFKAYLETDVLAKVRLPCCAPAVLLS